MRNPENKIGVQKGTKRGPYNRCAQKRERQSDEFQGGLSYHEIAEILDITPGEVKKIEAAALKKLQKPSKANKELHQYHSITLRPAGAQEG